MYKWLEIKLNTDSPDRMTDFFLPKSVDLGARE